VLASTFGPQVRWTVQDLPEVMEGDDAARARKVLEYTRRVWRRPVRLRTVNERADPVELAA